MQVGFSRSVCFFSQGDQGVEGGVESRLYEGLEAASAGCGLNSTSAEYCS